MNTSEASGATDRCVVDVSMGSVAQSKVDFGQSEDFARRREAGMGGGKRTLLHSLGSALMGIYKCWRL